MRVSVQRRAQLWWTLGQPAVLAALVLAVAALAVAGYCHAAYWAPVVERHEQARERLETLRADVRRLRSVEGRVARYRHNTKAVEALEERLASDASQAALVGSLTELAERHRVDILGESSREGEASSGLAPLRHTLEMRGTYESVRQVVIGVERLPTLTLVHECRMVRAERAGQVTVQLELVTYRRAGAEVDG